MIQAIPTFYNGHRFRSRLEARWAVFFKTLGIDYEYEKEGVMLAGKRYLPDFWLPQQKYWVEIKGRQPDFPEQKFMELIAAHSGYDAFIFWGDIPYPTPARESAYRYFPDGGADAGHWWCSCPTCGALDIQYQGLSGRIRCFCKKEVGDLPTFDAPELLAAYAAARAMRFWEPPA